VHEAVSKFNQVGRRECKYIIDLLGAARVEIIASEEADSSSAAAFLRSVS
jgi:hypothetical protein